MDNLPSLADWKASDLGKRLIKENQWLKTDDDIISFIKMNFPSNPVKESFIDQGGDFLRAIDSPLQEGVTPFSNQMKSSIGNNGMFDMTDPNIYKQEGGEEREEFIPPFSKEDWEYYRSKFPRIPYPPPGITPTPEPELESEPEPIEPSYTILSPESLLRQAFAESSFRPDAVSDMDARGIAQFRPITIEEMQRLGIVDDTFDPFDINQAIPAQRAYMTYLSERPQLTQGSEESINSKILFAYNRGLTGAVEELTNLKNKIVSHNDVEKFLKNGKNKVYMLSLIHI